MASILDIFDQYGIPVPSIYQAESDTANSQYQQALASIAQQQGQASQQYGFTPTVDPTTGALTDFRIDPANAYSQIMTNLNQHASDMQTLRNGLSQQGLAGAAEGTGHQLTGLAAQRANLLRFQQQGQTAGIGQQYEGLMGGFQNQQAAALQARTQGYSQAAMDSVNYAISNGLFNKAGSGNIGGTPPGGTPALAGAPASAANANPNLLAAPASMGSHVQQTGANNEQLAAHLGLPSGIMNTPSASYTGSKVPTAANPNAGQTARNSF